MIFDVMKKEFQSRCTENKLDWAGVREMLFHFKKTMDQQYRNMLWHFRNTKCEKCDYWDNVYCKHVANVEQSPQEISDEDMLKAAMEVDGASE